MRKRNEWDVLKCLATLLVVIGHIVILYKQGGSFPAMENRYLAMLADVIYLFHMPLFVTISGLYMPSVNNRGNIKISKVFW